MRTNLLKCIIIASFTFFCLATNSATKVDEYITKLEKHRLEKDEYFKKDAKSPIPEELKISFNGLKYFPLNEKYMSKLKLNEVTDKKEIILGTSTGVPRKMIYTGYFTVKIDDMEFKLHAYQPLNSSSLFIPFRDKTSGKETYGGGRYIDLEITDDGWYLVDFNTTYNPYCVYNKKYSCPIPPEENNIPFEIRAGEKKFK